MKEGTSSVSEVNVDTATMIHIDQSQWTWKGDQPHAVKMIGFFVPPSPGAYQFCVKITAKTDLYMSQDEDPNNKVFFYIYVFNPITTIQP